MEQTETNKTDTEIERRVREMAEADMRRAVEMMKVMNQAFGLINRIDRKPPSDGDGEGVRVSER